MPVMPLKPRVAPPALKRIPTNVTTKTTSTSTNRISPTLNNNNKNSTSSSSPPPAAKEKVRRISQVPNKVKDAEGNINVVVRCRGRSPYEIRDNSTLVASAVGTRGTSVTLTNPSSTITTSSAPSLVPSVQIPATKTYNFGERIEEGKNPLGNVFGPDADQGMLYNDVARPILEQVLQGYNCTIFAYGQTGTGKTYTMEGDTTPYHGTFSPNAGIIPRTLYSLFEKLAEDGSEYSVRCSFIELYNEDLRDLNALEFSEPNAINQPMASSSSTNATSSVSGSSGSGGLKIYDDKNAGTMIFGLEETSIRSAEEGIKVLKRGSERRQIAATKCNEHSSRSHSIFTITVHIKETGKAGGEDLLKVGKLNLVDLAGSENVGRSGAEKGRAREAGMINVSLLALGRVINKLVEKEKHIPYRESNLTRLLQDSLGGRTKTTIIATISPVNFEETISTLDYALRAKSIQNRPEVNRRVTKHALLGQYATEIERLKSDLLAAREKNGIFLSSETWAEHHAEQISNRLKLEEAKRQIEIHDSALQSSKSQFEQNLRLLGTREVELKIITSELEVQSKELLRLAGELIGTQVELEGETVLREAFERSRGGWMNAADEAQRDVDGLRQKLARKSDVESSNKIVITNASVAFRSMSEELRSQMLIFKATQDDFTQSVRSQLNEFSERESQNIATNDELIIRRLVELEASSQAIRDTAGSIGHSGHNFDQVVKNTKEELLEASKSLATKSQSLLKAQEEIILSSLSKHEAMTLASIESIVEPMRVLHLERCDALAKDAEVLRLVHQEDVEYLANENARLKQVIEKLNETLEKQRQVTIDEDAQVLALLTAKLEARSLAHLAALGETHSLVKSSLEESFSSQEIAQESRGKRLNTLVESNVEAGKTWERKMVEVEGIAESTKQDLTSSLSSVGTLANVYGSSVRTYVIDNERIASSTVETLGSAGATFRTDASTSHAIFDETFDNFTEGTRSTYASIQKEFNIVGEDIDETTRGLLEINQSQAIATTTFSSTSSNHLLSLQADIKSYLETDIRADIPTGTTPRKKEWSKDSLLPIVDLDGERSEVRNVLIQAKRRTEELIRKKEIVVEEREEEEEMIKVVPLAVFKAVLGEVDLNSTRRNGGLKGGN